MSDCTEISDGIPHTNRTTIRLLCGLASADWNWRRNHIHESDLVKLLHGSAHVAWQVWDWIGLDWDQIGSDLLVICGIVRGLAWAGGIWLE